MKLYQKEKPIKTTECTFSLEGRVRSKKNSKQLATRPNGKMFIRSSDQFTAWENMARHSLLKQKIALEAQGYVFPIEGKIRLHLVFEMAGRQHEPDVSNLIEGPQDLLQDLKIIRNDKDVVEVYAIKRMDMPLDVTTIHVSKSLEA